MSVLTDFLPRKYDCGLDQLNEKLNDLDNIKELNNRFYLTSSIDGPIKNVQFVNSTPDQIRMDSGDTLMDHLKEKHGITLKHPELFCLWDKDDDADRYHPLELLTIADDVEWNTEESVVEFLCSYFHCNPKDINKILDDPENLHVETELKEMDLICFYCGPLKLDSCGIFSRNITDGWGSTFEETTTECSKNAGNLKYPDLDWLEDTYMHKHPLEYVTFDNSIEDSSDNSETSSECDCELNTEETLVEFLCSFYHCNPDEINKKLRDSKKVEGALNRMTLKCRFCGPLKLNVDGGYFAKKISGGWGAWEYEANTKCSIMRYRKYPDMLWLVDKDSKKHPLEYVTFDNSHWNFRETVVEFLCSYFKYKPHDIDTYMEDTKDLHVERVLRSKPMKCRLCGPIDFKLLSLIPPCLIQVKNKKFSGTKTNYLKEVHGIQLKYPLMMCLEDKNEKYHPLELVTFEDTIESSEVSSKESDTY